MPVVALKCDDELPEPVMKILGELCFHAPHDNWEIFAWWPVLGVTCTGLPRKRMSKKKVFNPSQRHAAVKWLQEWHGRGYSIAGKFGTVH